MPNLFRETLDRIMYSGGSEFGNPTELARAAGFPKSQMSRWRRRERTPEPWVIKRLCAALGCTPKQEAELMVSVGHRVLDDPRFLEFETWLASVSAQRREKVIASLLLGMGSHPA
jgi:transcriptional regulator with XRE-family HTH domain